MTDALTPTPTPVPAIDFTLKDQYGETHSLADYKGKNDFPEFLGYLVSSLQGGNAGYPEDL